MATSAPVMPSTQSGQLCDYCHQKPKFSNHSYCSKTCAGQAAALCNHCHKKPKFQNFEFCGKNCAALANPGGKPRNPAPAAAAAPPQYGGGSKQAHTNSNGNGIQGAFDPIQLAKLVAQHIPQVQAMFNPGPQAQVQAAPAPVPMQQPQHIIANPFANPIQPQVMQTAIAPSNNPFLGSGPVNQGAPTYNPNGAGAGAAASGSQSQQSAAMMNGAPTVPKSMPNSSLPMAGAQPLIISTQQSADNLECLIPGCGQPVHNDAKGVKMSEYCSMRHREEAVAIGLASPCIMCLTFPQSEMDYFCSRGCREESLNKHGVVEDEDLGQ